MATTSSRQIVRFATVVILGFAGLTAANLNAAEAQEYTSAQRIACTPDAWRLCSGSMPFIADVKACMIANKANLSPACKAQFAKEVATR